MKAILLSVVVAVALGLLSVGFPQPVAAEEPKLFIPDKALCAKMLRHGKEAYMRGKYLDAKAYFRKAVQADPTSQTAWRYYDQAAIFALAERVEKDAGLIMPGVSTRQTLDTETPSAPPPPPTAAAPAKKEETEFRIVEDEGC
jgi:hypothetical protein